jgi:ABC-type transport system involved in multi-copper enzyme maturation permease subunit
MKKTLSISKFTLLESIRDKFFLVVVLLFVVSIGFSFFSVNLVAVEQDKAFASILSSMLYFSSASIPLIFVPVLIRRELESNLMMVIKSKPVKGFQYVLGRIAGIGILLMFVCAVEFLLIKLLCKVSTKGALLYSFGTYLEHLLTAEAGFLFSVSLNSLASSITMTFMFFFIAHNTYEFAKMAVLINKPVLTYLAKGIYYIFPSYDLFDFSRTLVYGDLPTVKIPFLLGYFATYLVALWCLCVISFEKKEF